MSMAGAAAEALAEGQAVEWTADGGRAGHGQLVRIEGPWAVVAGDDGQIQAVPAAALRRWAPAGQFRLL
ncbi:MAG: hypothetical protein ACYCT1_08150 [Steroidobacteraceae bacterium]